MSDRDLPPAIPTIVISEDTEGASGKSLKLTNGPAADTPQSLQDVQKDETSAVPGALPTQPAAAIPDWYKVGWRQSSGIDNPPLPEGEERDKGVLDMFIAEQYYGAWYHNAGIIIFVRIRNIPCGRALMQTISYVYVLIDHLDLFLLSASLFLLFLWCTGCFGNTLPCAVQLWLGVGIRCACDMQYLLYNIYGAPQA